MKLRRLLLSTTLLALSLTVGAQSYQSLYNVKGNKVTYKGKTIKEADIRTFSILGNGYAKDVNNVYLDGGILRYADPATFTLKGQNGQGAGNGATMGQGHGHNTGNGAGNDYFPHDNAYNNGDGYGHGQQAPSYHMSSFEVFFAGKKVQGATASSFKDLGHGYGKDAFSAYYYGVKIPQSTGSSFEVLEGGYSKDAFHVYFEGESVENSSGNSFKYLGSGYGKDAFHVYFRGQLIEGAMSSSFKIDTDGYSHDAFNTFYYGKKIK